MTPISQHKVGLVVATLMGGRHLLRSLLVALGLAQPLVDFCRLDALHQAGVSYRGFHPARAGVLVVVTTTLVTWSVICSRCCGTG